VAMIAEALGEPLLELLAALLHLLKQIVLPDHVLHRECGRAGEGVREISVAVLKRTGAGADGVDDPAAREHCTDRLIAAAEPLCDRLDIRRDAFLLPGVRGAGAAH